MGHGCCCGHFRETKMAPLFAKQKAGCCGSEKEKPAAKKKSVKKVKKARKK